MQKIAGYNKNLYNEIQEGGNSLTQDTQMDGMNKSNALSERET